MAPRDRTCVVCKQVSAIEHVALLLWDEEGNRLPPKAAHEYVRSIGMDGPRKTIENRVASHRKHVEAWIARGGVVRPLHDEGNVVRIPPKTGPQRWIDVQQNAMDLGNDALRELHVRLASGDMDTKDMVALAKLGVGAANTRGQMEQKGKALNGIDKLLKLAAGGKA